MQGNTGIAPQLNMVKHSTMVTAGILCTPSVFQNLAHSDQALANSLWYSGILAKDAIWISGNVKGTKNPNIFHDSFCGKLSLAWNHTGNWTWERQTFHRCRYIEHELEQKSEWLHSKPVTAVWQFQHCFSSLHQFIMSKAWPLDTITEFIEKVEFHTCGSSHYHVIYWVKNVPTLDVDSNEVVCRFINEYITTIVPEDDETSAH